MRAFVLTAALLAATITPAAAQDSRPGLWQGFYLGGNGGYVAGTGELTYPSGLKIGATNSGGYGGLQLGYNFRAGDWVFGPELASSAVSTTGSTPCSNVNYTCRIQTQHVTHLNARFGHAYGNTLMYATGGLSSGKMNYTAENPANGNKYDSGFIGHTGWNVGVGVEYAFAARWSAGLEFRHVQLGNAVHSSRNNFGGAVTDRTISGTTDMLGARVNYNFGK
jgi:outer membrane immunogenic protein